MPYQLIKLALDNKINIDFWNFRYPIEAIYFCEAQPCIALSNSLFNNRAHFRTVLLEELGHHFTSAGERIVKAGSDYNYREILEIGRQEHMALAWAARYIMPVNELEKAFSKGIRSPWELANYFDVDEKLAKFRIVIYFEREKKGA